MNGKSSPPIDVNLDELDKHKRRKVLRNASVNSEVSSFLNDRRQDCSMRNAVSCIFRVFEDEKNYAAALKELLIQICSVSGLPYACSIHSARLSEGVLFDENNQEATGDLCLSHAKNAIGTISDLNADQISSIADKIKHDDVRALLAAQLIPRVLTEHSDFNIASEHNDTLIQSLSGHLLVPIWVGEMKRVAFLLLPEEDGSVQAMQRLKYIRPLLGAYTSLVRLNIAHLKTNLTKRGQCSLEPAGDVALMRVERLFDHLYEPVLVLGARSTVISMNPSARELFGDVQDAEKFIGMRVEELLPGYTAELIHARKYQEDLEEGRASLELHLLARRPDNALLPLSCRVIDAPYGKSVLILQDVHRLRRATDETIRESERFKTLADMAPVGILEVDAEWNVCYANERWCNSMRLPREELYDERWLRLFPEEQLESIVQDLHSAIYQGQDFSIETPITTTLGELGWGEFCAHPLLNESGQPEGFIATLSDTTFRHDTESKLRELAEHDSLTGLVSRHGFMLSLEDALSSSRSGGVALLCLDLDDFKHVNDTLGHDFGDEVLKEIANRIQTAIRSEDVVARMGGDEFVLILPAVEQGNVCSIVAEKVLGALSVPMNIKGHEIFSSASVGISLSTPSKPLDSKTLLKQADMALYKAKAKGKNTYEYYTADLQKSAEERLYLGNSLHNALARQEFVSYFQLQLHIPTGLPCGVECLVRWQHPTIGLLAPDRFISLLEETGLIDSLFVWQANDAWQKFCGWKQQGLLPENATLSFNLSGRHFQSLGFVKILIETMSAYEIDPKQVVFEITESTLLHNTDQVRDMLVRFKEMGFRIAMDDFGTGFSSLTYLKSFPIDEVKIDKSFVQDILVDDGDREITKAVINLSKSMNKTCVAEGVESEEILALLGDWGCDEAQGYFINRPMPDEQFITLLKSYKRNE